MPEPARHRIGLWSGRAAAALVAADYLIIPTRLDQLAIKGVRDALQGLVAINKVSQRPCSLLGILPTFYDRVTSESQAQLKHLVAAFKRAILPFINSYSYRVAAHVFILL